MTYAAITRSPAAAEVAALFSDFDREFRNQFNLLDEHLSDLDLYPDDIKGALFVRGAMSMDPGIQTYPNAIGNVSINSGQANGFVKLIQTPRVLDIHVKLTVAKAKGESFIESNSILNRAIIETQIEVDHGLNEIKKRIVSPYPWLREISVLGDTWDVYIVSHRDDLELWVLGIEVYVRLQWFLSQFPDGRHYHLGSDTAPVLLSAPNLNG